MSEETELKPCPAGHKGLIEIVELDGGETLYFPYCENSDDCTWSGIVYASTLEEAIAIWNNRPVEDELRKRIHAYGVVIEESQETRATLRSENERLVLEVKRLQKYINGERSRHLEIVVDLGEKVEKLTAENEWLKAENKRLEVSLNTCGHLLLERKAPTDPDADNFLDYIDIAHGMDIRDVK